MKHEGEVHKQKNKYSPGYPLQQKKKCNSGLISYFIGLYCIISIACLATLFIPNDLIMASAIK